MRGSSARSTALTGDGTDSRSSRRVPGRHGTLLLGLRREHPHVHRAARVDQRREAAHRVRRRWSRSTVRGSSSRSSGQVRSPVRSSSPATASATACRIGAASCVLQRLEVLAARHLGAVGRLDGERDPQVRRQLVEVEGVDRHEHTGAPVQFALQRPRSSGPPSGVDRGEHGARGVGCGNEVAAQVLWQRPDQRGDEFLAQRRYLPGELVAAEAGQHLDRHVHRDAVVLGAGLEPVGQRQRQVARLPGVRLLGGGVVLAQQVVAGERQQVGRLVPLLLPPRVEVPRRDDVGGDARVVEGVDLVVADEQVAAAGPLLELCEFLTQPGVVAEEVVPGLPVALDERVPDEQIPGDRRVDLRVADAAARPPAAGRRASPARRP